MRPPRGTKVMENNPQLAQVLNDPAMMRQYLDMARNPEVQTEKEPLPISIVSFVLVFADAYKHTFHVCNILACYIVLHYVGRLASP